MEGSSQISGFYKKDPKERVQIVRELTGLSDDEVEAISTTGGTSLAELDSMIENVLGSFELPFGVATNFQINDKDYLIPMAIEEPSVVAAASNAAKMARTKGGFKTSSSDPIMIGQIQLVDVSDPFGAKMKILEKKGELIAYANEQDPILVKFGGGCQDLEVRVIDTPTGTMVVTHILVDCRDAMGANAVNTMAEAVAPKIEEITGGRVYLRILSNLAVHRLTRAWAVFDKESIGGEGVVDGVLEAYSFAVSDPYRAATHNKGIMNGIIAVVRATGNDTRAVEAGAHSFASLSGQYTSLSRWEKNSDGNLVGSIELPMPVGLIGGATAVHPVAKAAVKILGIETAKELQEIIAAVGLAQNFGAMRALATDGIQRGHMRLHARNMAATAGATGELIDKVVERLVASGQIRMDKAKEILEELQKEVS